MKHYVVITFKGANKVLKHYCTDQQEALRTLRATPGARMMVFSSKNDIPDFLATPITTTNNRPVTDSACIRPRGAVDYDGRYDRCFLQAVEAGDQLKVFRMIVCVPALLINDTYHPRVYTKQGENALHIAARRGFSQICNHILQAIGSPLFIATHQGKRTEMTTVLSEKLLELYLNSAERYRYDTPIHLAVEHGWVSVVRVLISYPQCELKPNIWNHYPQDLVCVRATGARTTSAVYSTIAGLLQENYFVPLIRTECDLEPPFVGEPFSRLKPPDLTNQTGDVLAPQRVVTAFAGPMTLVMAQHFRKQWQSSPRLTVVPTNTDGTHDSSPPGRDTQLLCSVTQKLYDQSNLAQAPGYIVRAFRRRYLNTALERIGRYMAKALNMQWKEYWPFLNLYCDLSEPYGLRMLEKYLAYKAANLSLQQDATAIAIGGSIKNRENLFALFAIANVEINEQLYPFITRWKHNMSLILNAD
ncbi:ankyrin repeat and LEM domain-containing protein 2-like [Anopheles marshallii]|uniref:ankyrin repeat and LEM domain-containing protein 2-like n=1 Tax=Anopheles marshallii TaxID=1521116 RepID=UPI00237C4C22|nr:ankyrin repeat and LEM domain-containing protein 2-like [Anopheles marshallii]